MMGKDTIACLLAFHIVPNRLVIIKAKTSTGATKEVQT